MPSPQEEHAAENDWLNEMAPDYSLNLDNANYEETGGCPPVKREEPTFAPRQNGDRDEPILKARDNAGRNNEVMKAYVTATPDALPSSGLGSLVGEKSTGSEFISSTTKSTGNIRFGQAAGITATFDSPTIITAPPNHRDLHPESDVESFTGQVGSGVDSIGDKVTSAAGPVISDAKSAKAMVSSVVVSFGSAVISQGEALASTVEVKLQTHTPAASGACARSALFLPWPLLLVVLCMFYGVSGTFALPNTSSPGASVPTGSPEAPSIPDHTASPAVPPTTGSPAAPNLIRSSQPTSSRATLRVPSRIPSMSTPSSSSASQTNTSSILPNPGDSDAADTEKATLQILLVQICDDNQSFDTWGDFTGFCGQPVGPHPPDPAENPNYLPPVVPVPELDIKSTHLAVSRREGLRAMRALVCELNVEHDTWEKYDDICPHPDGDRPLEPSKKQKRKGGGGKPVLDRGGGGACANNCSAAPAIRVVGQKSSMSWGVGGLDGLWGCGRREDDLVLNKVVENFQRS